MTHSTNATRSTRAAIHFPFYTFCFTLSVASRLWAGVGPIGSVLALEESRRLGLPSAPPSRVHAPRAARGEGRLRAPGRVRDGEAGGRGLAFREEYGHVLVARGVRAPRAARARLAPQTWKQEGQSTELISARKQLHSSAGCVVCLESRSQPESI